jgi:choline dehydrogenase-like flavoprotein
MEALAGQKWDYIIVGTGMGGATLGYTLAKSGRSVLFLEKGRSHLRNPAALTGDYAEAFCARTDQIPSQLDGVLAAAGRYTETLEDISGPRTRSFVPFVGSGTGGSSALYGMALERFTAADFSPGHHYPTAGDPAAGGSSIPTSWPLQYEELSPYYHKAERLFRVRGTVDPHRQDEGMSYLPPPTLSTPNQTLYDFLRRKGMHPYQLPLACEQVAGCEGCQSYLCARKCKNDSSRICLEPALDEHGAQLLDECEALRLEANATRVEGIECSRRGQTITLRADRYIIAAGALETPKLLLNSASGIWPTGLANDSTQVGKNLMRHYIDLYAVFCKERLTRNTRVKELAFNDFYLRDGRKLGSVQSFGFLPPARMLVNEIARDLQRDVGRLAGAAFNLVKPLARTGLNQLFSHSLILATTLEDLPYERNRVQLSATTDDRGRRGLQISYTIAGSEQLRIATFRRVMKEVLQPRRFLLLKQAHNNERIAHVCGTCRFGTDPRNSVCDANNKVHAMSNLYIADSSVFPSSGGINPSLTIAALSLRLAAHLECIQNE